MQILINASSPISRIGLSLLILLLGAEYASLVINRFVVTSLTHFQVVSCATLEAAVLQFPSFAKNHSRLASCLLEVNATENHDEIVRRALTYAMRATQLAPWQYENWIVLSAAQEKKGDLSRAENALRRALSVAPQHVRLHWQLANLLVREEKIELAIEEFQLAIAGNPALLPASLEVVWQATGKNIQLVSRLVSKDSRSQLVFAKFLTDQAQFAFAEQVISSLGTTHIVHLPEAKQLLGFLITAQEFALADKLWQRLEGEREKGAVLWNGGFEGDSSRSHTEFNWQLANSDYVRVGITTGEARSGKRSLVLEYAGKETTRLENEVRQLMVVRPGQRYRLEGYAKTSSLVTRDGPCLVVSKINNPSIIAETALVVGGTHDWQLLSLDFQVPPDATALLIRIKQSPRFSYSDPTKGTVWFDDLSVREQ